VIAKQQLKFTAKYVHYLFVHFIIILIIYFVVMVSSISMMISRKNSKDPHFHINKIDDLS